MSLEPGASFGPYTVVSKLGEGGMGEVYRATDSRLGRDVAIKILPASVADDPDRRARFDREAKALAALNHFNIAQVYGLEGSALVMELLEGQTLRDRLASGALPVRKALDFGGQIARGLAAAHERGIIHRDLKPDNVFIVNDGQIKILDFGLARQIAMDAHGATATSEGTAPGVVMGTAGYMSPEQVRGAAVDSRSDVFSLGVVLFEMLTGQRAFRRDTTAETMTAILNEHPADVSRMRTEVGAAVDRIVQHCLEKQPSERFQSARDVAFALEALSGSASSVAATQTPAPRRNLERLAWAALTVALAIAALWPSIVPARETSAPQAVVSRTQLLLPEGVILNESLFPGARLALSADGTQIVFGGRDRRTGAQQLYLQALNGGPPNLLPGATNGAAPSWSPDGRQIIYSDYTRLLRVSLDGGAPVVLAELPTIGQPAGWGPDGTVLVGGRQLRRLPAQGGPMAVIRNHEGERYGYPQFLPDGRHFLLAVIKQDGAVSVRVATLDSSDDRELLRGSDITSFAYAAGALIFSRGGTLYAQRFDLARSELRGDVVTLASHVESFLLRGATFAVSTSGVLVYQSSEAIDTTQLTWLDRTGRVVSTIGEPADFTNIELSNDGRRVLASASDAGLMTRDVFIVDVARGVRQRFTLDPSDERSAVWSPDQKQVIYTSKGLDLYARASDLSGEERPVQTDGASKDPYDVSPDGRLLLYRRTGNEKDTGNDMWVMPLDGGTPRPIASTRYSELGGNFSPDGLWIIYVSDESGQQEVYATRVDGGGKIQISPNGGSYPRWRGDGREILYVGPDQMLMSATIESASPTLEVASPKPLFRMDIETAPGPIYDVTADGTRFIVAARTASRIPPSITVLHNWPLLLPRP